MASILISIAARIAACAVHPILRLRQFDFARNVNNLSKEAEKRAKSKGDHIHPQVERWPANEDEIIEPVGKIEVQSKTSVSCFGGFCPSCINRCCISRKSTEKAESVAELQEQGKLDRVSRQAPLSAVEYSSSGNFIAFDSRIGATDQILKALQEDECTAVVLYGTRGTGKTELAKEVRRRVREKNLFEEVVTAVVDPKSNTPNLRDIQDQIVDMLGLKIPEVSDSGRACRLCMRLKDEKKMLIILDGVRQRLDLESIGIPSDNKGCKIMITTDSEDVCIAMEDEGVKKVEINALSKEESWKLFKSVTGESVAGEIDGNPALKVVAEDIVGKAKGLPLMIVSFGRKLRGRETKEWTRASGIIERYERKGANLDEFLGAYF